MKRPLSPHLQIYKFAWPMLYSVLHRASGMVLLPFLLWFVVWVVWAKQGSESFDCFVALNKNPIILAGLALGLASLIFHWLHGLRYLFWDMGKGFDLAKARFTGHLTGFVSLALTIIVLLYLAGFVMGGGI